ncbi:MAG: hypothetical protein VX228_10480, partial [Pseudomonadota bacterium]|nr:hypothetical protein [Pseudomonadota bacterium]
MTHIFFCAIHRQHLLNAVQKRSTIERPSEGVMSCTCFGLLPQLFALAFHSPQMARFNDHRKKQRKSQQKCKDSELIQLPIFMGPTVLMKRFKQIQFTQKRPQHQGEQKNPDVGYMMPTDLC